MDELVRDLERKALSGDAAALEKLRAAWGRSPMAPGVNTDVVPGRQIPVKQPLTWRWRQVPASYRLTLPKFEGFYLYGMSVIPDVGQDRALCRQVWNECELTITHHREPPKTPLISHYPMRLIMPNPDVIEIMAEAGAQKAYEALLNLAPFCKLTVMDKPVGLERLDEHPVDYNLQGGDWSFSCLFALYGIRIWTDPGELSVRTRASNA